MRTRFLLSVIPFLLSLFFAQNALATSWWGEGVRSDNWILSRGGALIRFEIVNKRGDSREYKAVLTRSSKNIEVETGKQGLFDDARTDRYKVTFYRGGDGKKSFNNLGGEIASKTFDVHKGESIKLRLNYEAKKVSMETTYVKPEKAKPVIAVKTQPKKVPPAISQENLVNDSKEATPNENEAEGEIIEESDENPDNENVPDNISSEPKKSSAVYSKNDICFSGIFQPAVCRNSPLPLSVRRVEFISPYQGVTEERKSDENGEKRLENDLRLGISHFFSRLFANLDLKP